MKGERLGAIRLEEPLGRGATGEVWRGVHEVTGLEVAVKVLRPGVVGSSEVSSLREEARVVAGLSHRHVVGVYDLGVASSAAFTGQLYLVMEYARLGSLALWRGRVAWPTLVGWIYQMLSGLRHVGARGVVHLDLKPANLLLTGDASQGGEVRLSDFGLGRGLGRERGASPGGTPGYMAPEQRLGRWDEVGPWTDLYALGMSVWELMGGPRLAPGQGPWALPGFPPALASWVARCVQASPGARFLSAAAAEASLEAACGRPAPGVLQHPAPAASPGGLEATWEATAPVVEAMTLPAPGASQGPAVEALAVCVAAPGAAPEAAQPPQPALFAGVGLGLYEVREPPLVGRVAERAQLWAALSAVSEARRPAQVVIEGEPGVGRSRLVRWLVEASREGADALALEGVEAPGQGSLVLGWLVEAALGAQGATSLEEALGCASRVAPGLGRGLLRGAWALVEEARDGGRRPRFSRVEEREEAALRLLVALARSRRLVLAVDDAPQAPVLTRLARRLVEQGSGAILVVLSGLPGAVPAAGAAVVRLAPLGQGEVIELVRHYVGVSSALAEELAARVGGSPAFAVHQLRDWIERGVLGAAPGGLVLLAPEVPKLPDTLYALWSERLEHLTAGAGAEERAGLTLLALLAEQATAEVAAAAWEAAGVAPPRALLARLEAAGVLARRGRAWRWVTPAQREACARGASPALHAACAAALTRCVKAPRPSAALLALAEHHLGAGDPGAALEALRGLHEAGMDPSLAPTCRALVARCAQVASPQEAAWCRALEASAWFLQGELEQASAVLGPLEAARQGEPAAQVSALGAHLLIAFSCGQAEAVQRCADWMLEVAAASGEPALCFRAEVAQGRAALLSRQRDQAVELLSRAIARQDPAITPMMRLVAGNLLGAVLLAAGRLEEASAALTALAEAAEAEGALYLLAHVWNSLGDLELRRARWAAAQVWLERGLEIAGERYPAAAYMRGNLALALLKRGAVDAASAQVEEALARLGLGARSLPWLYVHEILQGVLAEAGDGAAWDEALERLEAALPGFEVAHEEGAELAEASGRRWAARGDAPRARRAWALAAALWERLREPDRAAAAREHGGRGGGAPAPSGSLAAHHRPACPASDQCGPGRVR